MPKSKVRKVAIVDDHTLMREALARLVGELDGFSCCWTAGDAAEALAQVEADRPDLLITDMTLPGRNGLELIKDALALAGGLPILVVSMHDETLYAQRILKAGARGYIMKDASTPSLLEAIRKVADGGIWVSPSMSNQIIQAFSGQGNGGKVEGVHRLTDREFEIFQLIGEGRSKASLAKSLNISPKTVDVHRAHIREKLELEDSAAVLSYAVRWVEMRKLRAD